MYRNVKFHFTECILSYNKPIYKINDTINLKLIWQIKIYKLYYTHGKTYWKQEVCVTVKYWWSEGVSDVGPIIDNFIV